MGKPSPPPPPDYTPFAQGSAATAASSVEAAKIQADVAREQLAKQDTYAQRSSELADKYYQMAVDQQGFGREQYADIKPYLQQYMQDQSDLSKSAKGNLAEQLAAAQQARQQAAETYDRYRSIYAPKEDQFAKEAFDYASPARLNEAAAAARGDVATAFNAARESAGRQLAAYGVDPSQGRYAGTMQAQDISRAAAGAAAGTLARQQTANQGRQLQVAALEIGQKLPAQAVAEAGLSGNLATGAIGAANVGGGGVQAGYTGLQAGTTAMGSPTGYAQLSNPYTQLAGVYGNQGASLYGSSNQALGNATNAFGMGADILNMGFGNQMSIYGQQMANQRSLWQGLGSVAGMAAGGLMTKV